MAKHLRVGVNRYLLWRKVFVTVCLLVITVHVFVVVIVIVNKIGVVVVFCRTGQRRRPKSRSSIDSHFSSRRTGCIRQLFRWITPTRMRSTAIPLEMKVDLIEWDCVLWMQCVACFIYFTLSLIHPKITRTVVAKSLSLSLCLIYDTRIRHFA